jgi:hypothetical protein
MNAEQRHLHGLENTFDKYWNELQLLKRQEPDLQPGVFRFKEAQLVSKIGLYEDLIRRQKRKIANGRKNS